MSALMLTGTGNVSSAAFADLPSIRLGAMGQIKTPMSVSINLVELGPRDGIGISLLEIMAIYPPSISRQFVCHPLTQVKQSIIVETCSII
jgi:hypothetical protein